MTKNVISAELFPLTIELINNYESNKKSFFFKSQMILKNRIMLSFDNNI